MGKKIQFIGRYALEGQLLGKGSFARVELAHHSVTGCKVAIKIIDTRKLKEEYQKNNLHREARILGQLRHPNIVRLYETLKATTLHCLVLEYASGGELQSFIKLQKDLRLSEERCRPYTRQLVSALHYLHERGVAHRDLKMENIMLDTAQINVKLVDFGLSNTFCNDELMKTHCGSPEYAAPELFTAGEKYGLEIDIWSLGIVMYAMLVGKLPFTTPYTDQYRRQKLVQQMERGLVDAHDHEMSHLSADCQDLLHKVIEPSPSLRLPLLDMEIHPWFTENAKKPFFPFQIFPRDKVMKTQMQDSMSSLEEDEVISLPDQVAKSGDTYDSSIPPDVHTPTPSSQKPLPAPPKTYEELATALNMRKEILEQKVAENKSDELSAMFNMILDKKRQQLGIFDVDHTIKTPEKKEAKGRRSKSAHGKKHMHKGPPELILPSDDMTTDSALHSGNEPDHETKFSSFDFLALCSTPTWLGPERRKSRRRSRSPMPSPHILQHGSQGLSVRNQMKRDYLERQAIEMERELIREERAAAAGLASPSQDSQQHHQNNDHHTTVSSSLSVPGGDPALSQQNAFRRSSSFKLSRRRALSCGPSQRRKSSFHRSGSVDHHAPGKGGASQLSTKDGRSDSALARDATKSSSLKIRRRSTLGPHSETALRKRSVDFVAQASKSFLGVPSYDNSKMNLLTVPVQGLSNNLLKVPDMEINDRNLLQIPNTEMGSNPLLCVPNHDDLNHLSDDTLASPGSSKLPSAHRPGKLTLKECYPLPKENIKVSSQLLPLTKPVIPGTNGPLTCVEVHYGDSLNPSSSADLHQPSSHAFEKVASEIICNDMEGFIEARKLSSFYLDTTDKQGGCDNFFDNNSQKRHQKLSLLETSASFPLHLKPPPTSKSILFNISSHVEHVAVAMQNDNKSNSLCNSSENHVFLGAEESVLNNKDGTADLQHMFNGLVLSSEYSEENDDHVDSMTELISDSFREEVLTKAKPSVTSQTDLSSAHKASRPNSSATPDDEHLMRGSVSLTSFSKSSGSGRKSGGGKAKSPTTPTWLNLRTPLARIESFHSDDFECFADSDNDEQDSASSSANTPTVPCFAYKLHVTKNKKTKLKSSGNSKQSSCGCGSIPNSDSISSKMNRNSVDKKHSSAASGHARLDAAVTDPLLSSGSDTEQHEEGQERMGAHGKSKIHPMGADDRDAEVLSKYDTRYLSYHNAVTIQPNQIKNAINKFPKPGPEVEQGAKKKAFVKHLAWRKSFAQFLKRKRYHSPLVTSSPPCQQNQQIHRHHQQSQQIHQQQQPSPGSNNNNNDLAPSDSLPEFRNGISVLGQLQTKNLDITVTDDLIVTSQEGDSFKLAASTLSSLPMENIVTELIELQSSPKLQCPPSPSRAFDFSLGTDPPKMKTSCLLAWGTCQDCGREGISSEEDNEYFSPDEPTAVTLNLKPIGENNVSGNISCAQVYKL